MAMLVLENRRVNFMSKTKEKILEEKRQEIIKGVLDHNKKYGFPTKSKSKNNTKK